MIHKNNFFISQKLMLIAGVDESGCGSLVGSVIAAAVILTTSQIRLIPGLTDSKKLNTKNRLNLYKKIVKIAISWNVGHASPKEIDRLNILKARLLAMRRAIEQLSVQPDLILVDGNQSPVFKNTFYQCFVKGDNMVPIISAASIIAKVNRDYYISTLDALYPKYGFIHHKGYPTKFHLKQLDLYGPTIYHRKSFSPIKYMI